MRVENGTTLLVTGGRGALGSALAMVAGEEGWVVHAPGRGELDVRDEGMVERVIGGMERLDLLVCAAGMRRDGLVAGMSGASSMRTSLWLKRASSEGARRRLNSRSWVESTSGAKTEIAQLNGRMSRINSRATGPNPWMPTRRSKSEAASVRPFFQAPCWCMASVQCVERLKQASVCKSAHSATTRLIAPPQLVTSRPRSRWARVTRVLTEPLK